MSLNNKSNKIEAIWSFVDGILVDPSELHAATSAGFSKKVLEEKLKQCGQIVEQEQIYDVAEGRKRNATQALREAIASLKVHYSPLVTIARNLFVDDYEAIKTLELKGERDNSYSGMKLQFFKFYDGALDSKELLAAFASAGVTKAHLETGMKLYTDMVDLKRIQSLALKDMTKSSKAKKDITKEVTDWYTRTKNIIGAWKKMNIPKEG